MDWFLYDNCLRHERVNCFEEVFLKINSNIGLDIVKAEYISIIEYPLNHLNHLVSDPRQFWELLYDRINNQTWNQTFLLLESCL